MPTSQVQYLSDGFTIQAFLASPDAAPRQAPGIILLHEWWGLNDHIKDVAKRFAKEGFAVLAPDLYSRQGYKVTGIPAEAAKLMGAVSTQGVLRDMNASAKFLQQQVGVAPFGIGMVGFSMGATFALMVACHNSDVKAAAAFYGKVPPVETIRYLLCPVLYHYGAKDDWVTQSEVDLLKEGLAKNGKPGEIKVFPNAAHAFFNDTRPEAYRPEEASQAWRASLQFLRRYVR